MSDGRNAPRIDLLKLDGSNANQDIDIGSYDFTSDATVYANEVETNKIYNDGATLTVGEAGDIGIGDGTERDMYPETTLKINLGTSSNRFNDLYCETINLTTQTGIDHANITGNDGIIHVDWSSSSVENIHADNYTDTTYAGEPTIDITGTMISVVTAQVDHDTLKNFAGNEHIDWTGAAAGTIDATNIEDKFLRNDGDDTSSGTITSAGFLCSGVGTQPYAQGITIPATSTPSTWAWGFRTANNYGVAFDLDAGLKGRVVMRSPTAIHHEFSVFGNQGDVKFQDSTGNSYNYDASLNRFYLLGGSAYGFGVAANEPAFTSFTSPNAGLWFSTGGVGNRFAFRDTTGAEIHRLLLTGDYLASGFVDAVAGFKDNGSAGVDQVCPVYNDGTSGNVTSFTVSGGIITSVTLAP